jgi:hypothetical protein
MAMAATTVTLIFPFAALVFFCSWHNKKFKWFINVFKKITTPF